MRENGSALAMWQVLLTSSLVAALVTGSITAAIEIFYKPHQQRERAKAERGRAVFEDLLRQAVRLRKSFEGLMLQPRLGATTAEVGLQAQSLLKLADEISDECFKQPFVAVPCRGYQEWKGNVTPLLENLVLNAKGHRKAPASITPAKAKELNDALTIFMDRLKEGIEISY